MELLRISEFSLKKRANSDKPQVVICIGTWDEAYDEEICDEI